MTNKNNYKYKKLLNFKDFFKNNQKVVKLKDLSLARINKQKIQVKYIPNENFLKIIVNSNDTKTYYNFKKKKWQKLIFYILKHNRFDNQYYKLFDQNIYNATTYSDNFSNNFKRNLKIKQQFKTFYGYLKNNYYFKIIKQKNQKGTLNMLNLLEKRLDVILVRSNFALSLKNAQQIILHGHVFVNNIIIKKKSFLLKKGDKITVNTKNHKLLEYYILNSLMWPIYPKYLQINYSTLQILIIDKIKPNNNFYYFWLSLKSLK